jgi:hypothetical protein
VEKAAPVQVHFTLRLRDQRSKWTQDGCKIYMNSYMKLNESCFMVTWIIFKNHLLEVGLTQTQETMALRTLTTIGLFNFIMCGGLTWIEIVVFGGPVAYDITLYLRVHDHTTWFWRCVGTAFGHFLLGSHNVMVAALGSCVKKWPLTDWWCVCVGEHTWQVVRASNKYWNNVFIHSFYNITRRKLVHYNRLLRLGHCDSC